MSTREVLNLSMGKKFIYDLTCLIYQQVSETPSGTIRVDLRYAHYFLTNRKASTIFVKQHGKSLLIINHDEAEALVNHLLSNWELGVVEQPSDAFKSESNLEFRMKYHGLWDPDLDTFFSMPFIDRFNFLLNQELTEIFGVEFSWVRKLPYVLKIWYALVASLSKYPALFLLRVGQFVGVFLHTKRLKDSYRFITTRRQTSEYLIDRVSRDKDHQYLYIYTAYNRGFPFAALKRINDITNLEYCVFIHDLIIIYYSEYFLPVNHQEQLTWMKHLLTLDPHIITNSGETKSYIERFAREHNRHGGDITTAFIGVEPCFIRQQGLAPPVNKTNYFVVIATIEPRKNHLLLLNLWRDIAQRKLLAPLPELYLIGKRGWENENVVDMVERCLPINGLVHEATNLNDTDLIALLKGARALLYPTFAEGWGMPVVESLTLGVPVICSDIPELRESGQNIPDYINPIDGIAWMNTIIDYCRADSVLRNAQLQRISNFSPPTWEDHFKLVSKKLFSRTDDIHRN
jgi:glycosyltransferase involved in cell wall biosynthesis